MSHNELSYSHNSCYKLKIFGLGTSGCNAISYLRDQHYFDDLKAVSYTAIHTNKVLLVKSKAKKTVLLDKQLLSELDHNNASPSRNLFLNSCIVEQLKEGVAFFILMDLIEIEYISLVSVIQKLAQENKKNNQYFIVAIINECRRGNSNLLQAQFNQDKKELLNHCDMVIFNSAKSINRNASKENTYITDGNLNGYEQNYRSLRIFVNALAASGLILSSFSDVRDVVLSRREGIVVAGFGDGYDRAECAVIEVINKIEMEWGDSLDSGVKALLVDICTSQSDLTEFDDVVTKVAQCFSKNVNISIGMTTEINMEDSLELNILVVR